MILLAKFILILLMTGASRRITAGKASWGECEPNAGRSG